MEKRRWPRIRPLYYFKNERLNKGERASKESGDESLE